MNVVLAVLEGVATLIASLMVALGFCAMLWWLFRLVRHPEWGPPLVAVPVVLALAGWLPASELLEMSIAFAVVAALPFWIFAREWRLRHRLSGQREADRPFNRS